MLAGDSELLMSSPRLLAARENGLSRESLVWQPILAAGRLSRRPRRLWPFAAVLWADDVGHASACEGLAPIFCGFAHSPGAALKGEKFVAYPKRRPERPPAGKIACRTMRCAQAPSGQLSAFSLAGSQPEIVAPREDSEV